MIMSPYSLRTWEEAFAKEDEPRQTLLFHRAHPALGAAFRFGDRGSGTRVTPAASMSCLKAGQYFPSRSWMRYCPGAKAPAPW